MASAPWQGTYLSTALGSGFLELLTTELASTDHVPVAFLIDVRSVYRWENPLVSAKWLALYVCLWYTQHLLGFIVSSSLYRRCPPSKNSPE